MLVATRSLINTGGAITFGAPNIKTDHSHSFTYGILHFPLVAPLGLA
jgi:hypothetical protein